MKDTPSMPGVHEHARAEHTIAYWRVVVAAAPIVAVVALACGITFDAKATDDETLEMIQVASWAIAAAASLWFGIITMTGATPRTTDALHVRMLFERNSPMRHQANAQSAVCAAVTLTVVVAMVR